MSYSFETELVFVDPSGFDSRTLVLHHSIVAPAVSYFNKYQFRLPTPIGRVLQRNASLLGQIKMFLVYCVVYYLVGPTITFSDLPTK